MLRIKSKFLAVKSLVCVAVCATLFSFSAGTGRHSFEVYLGDKLMLKEFVSTETDVKSFSLDQRFYNDDVKVNYNQCGLIGKGRSLSIKDAQNKVLKEWQFADVTDGVSPFMTCKVKDILSLKKNGRRLNLVYSSKEVPDGQSLAVIILESDNKVSLN